MLFQGMPKIEGARGARIVRRDTRRVEVNDDEDSSDTYRSGLMDKLADDQTSILGELLIKLRLRRPRTEE